MFLKILKLSVVLGSFFYTLYDMTDGFQKEFSYGVLNIAYTLFSTAWYSCLVAILVLLPIFILTGFLGRIASRTLGMSNEKVADHIVSAAQDILDDQFLDDDISLVYADHLAGSRNWSNFYYKVQSPALERLEGKYGKSYGVLIQLHKGWIPYYIIAGVRGMNDRTAHNALCYGGMSKRAARVIAKRAKMYHDKAARKTNFKATPKSVDGLKSDEFAI